VKERLTPFKEKIMPSTQWNLDPAHSSVNFSIKHMMIAKVHGTFEKLTGKLEFDSASPRGANVEVAIESASVNTREAQRDTHLKSPDFFDVEKFPVISFKSSQVERDGEGLKVTGDLSIHGVTQKVVLSVDGPTGEAKDPWGQTRIGASATTKIKRKDFGLTWNSALEAGGFLVGDDVSISLDVQFVKV